MLERMSMPHVWQLSRGEAAHVHTPETQRAKVSVYTIALLITLTTIVNVYAL